jgi:hypothetical protein
MNVRSRFGGLPTGLSPKRGRRRGARVVLVALTFAIVSVPRHAPADPINLLANSGFESGDFSGWTVSGTSVQFGVARDQTLIPNADPPFPPNVQNVRSGQYAANALLSQFAEPVERIILSQAIRVPAQQTLQIGFWIGSDSQSAFGMNLGDQGTQIFVDGTGILRNSFTQPEPGSSPQDFTLISGAFHSGSRTTIDVVFSITGSGSSRVGASLDDFFAQPVPEPSSMLLVGAGVIAALRHRRLRGIRTNVSVIATLQERSGTLRDLARCSRSGRGLSPIKG